MGTGGVTRDRGFSMRILMRHNIREFVHRSQRSKHGLGLIAFIPELINMDF